MKTGNIKLEIAMLVCLVVLSTTVSIHRVNAFAVPGAFVLTVSGTATPITGPLTGCDCGPGVLNASTVMTGSLFPSDPCLPPGTEALCLTGDLQLEGLAGTVTIGDPNVRVLFQIVNGTGSFNPQSLVVVIHAALVAVGTAYPVFCMQFLFGHANNPLTGPGTTAVTFSSPESKLVRDTLIPAPFAFFLGLSGTLTSS